MGDTRAIDSLERGIETAKSGNKLLARLHLLQAVELAPRDPNCWLWLAWVAESPASAIHSLQRVLDDDPDHELAQLGMQWAKAMANYEYQDYNAEAGASEIAERDAPHTEHAADETYEDFSSTEGYTDRGFSDERYEAEEPVITEDEDTAALAGERDSSILGEEDPEADGERESFAGCDEENPEKAPVVGEGESHTDSEQRRGFDAAEWSLNNQRKTAEAEASYERESAAGWFDEEDFATPAENEGAEIGESAEAPRDAEHETSFAEEAEADAGQSSWEEDAGEESRHDIEDSPSAWGEPIEESPPEESVLEDLDAPEHEETRTEENSTGTFWHRSEAADEESAEISAMEVAAEAEEAFVEEAVPADDILPPVATRESEDGVSVLVVDDSPTVRKLVTMTLEKHGYTVAAAADGVVALKSIAEFKPRLILLDITMPRLGGYQLCKLLKKHEATKHIPVIMLSGKDGMFDKVRGKFVGCDDYITKPFDPDLLIEKVSAQLSEHSGAASTPA